MMPKLEAVDATIEPDGLCHLLGRDGAVIVRHALSNLELAGRFQRDSSDDCSRLTSH